MNKIAQTNEKMAQMTSLERMEERIQEFGKTFKNANASFVLKQDLKAEVDKFNHDLSQVK